MSLNDDRTRWMRQLQKGHVTQEQYDKVMDYIDAFDVDSQVIAELTNSRPQTALEIVTALNKIIKPFTVLAAMHRLEAAGHIKAVTDEAHPYTRYALNSYYWVG